MASVLPSSSWPLFFASWLFSFIDIIRSDIELAKSSLNSPFSYFLPNLRLSTTFLRESNNNMTFFQLHFLITWLPEGVVSNLYLLRSLDKKRSTKLLVIFVITTPATFAYRKISLFSELCRAKGCMKRKSTKWLILRWHFFAVYLLKMQ